MLVWFRGRVKGNYNPEYLKLEWGHIFFIPCYCTGGKDEFLGLK